MTVYRELAAELRANKSVIDSLNSRNQQLLQQNQMLKHEIHNVVQATLSLGKAAGVAMPASGIRPEFPSAIAPDTLAKLVRDERQPSGQLANQYDYYEQTEPMVQPPLPVPIAREQTREQARERAPRPIEQAAVGRSADPRATGSRTTEPRATEPRAKRIETQTAPVAKKGVRKAAPKNRGIDQNLEKIAKRQKAVRQAAQRNEAATAPKAVPAAKKMKAQAPKKLFSEQTGELRHAPMDSEEIQEIGGIWLVLSIILIIVTAFGAGFLIMKPLLGNR